MELLRFGNKGPKDTGYSLFIFFFQVLEEIVNTFLLYSRILGYKFHVLTVLISKEVHLYS